MEELEAKNPFLRFAGYKTSKKVLFGPFFEISRLIYQSKFVRNYSSHKSDFLFFKIPKLKELEAKKHVF